MRSPSSLRSFGKRSSSTRLVCSLVISAEWIKSVFFGQLSQQQSVDNRVSQLAVSFLPPSWSSELTREWSNVGFPQRIFETSRGRAAYGPRRCILMCRQKAPGIKGKIQPALSRLGRLKVEGGVSGDEREPKQRRILFEYVSSMAYERVCILTLNCSGPSRELRTGYEPYLSAPVRLTTRRMTKTCRPYAGSRRILGTPWLSTRSALISQLPSRPDVEEVCSFTNRRRCTIRTVNWL